jgi:hypothetical protein
LEWCNGCNGRQIQDIRSRIATATDTELQHPLLAAGIFAELDRERLIEIADELIDSFTLRSEVLDSRYLTPELHAGGPKARENLALCLRSRNLVDHMKSVKRQLAKLVLHIDKLDGWIELKKSDGNAPFNAEARQQLKKSGEKIKVRILDMIDEYDDKIDECKLMDKSLSLVMQTVSDPCIGAVDL